MRLAAVRSATVYGHLSFFSRRYRSHAPWTWIAPARAVARLALSRSAITSALSIPAIGSRHVEAIHCRCLAQSVLARQADPAVPRSGFWSHPTEIADRVRRKPQSRRIIPPYHRPIDTATKHDDI